MTDFKDVEYLHKWLATYFWHKYEQRHLTEWLRECTRNSYVPALSGACAVGDLFYSNLCFVRMHHLQIRNKVKCSYIFLVNVLQGGTRCTRSLSNMKTGAKYQTQRHIWSACHRLTEAAWTIYRDIYSLPQGKRKIKTTTLYWGQRNSESVLSETLSTRVMQTLVQ